MAGAGAGAQAPAPTRLVRESELKEAALESNGTATRTGPATPRAGVEPKEIEAVAQQQSLERLLAIAAPLVQLHYEAQRESQRRELAFEKKLLIVDAARERRLLVSGTLVSLAVLGLAAMLFAAGRDAVAVDLIKLLVTVGGAAAGGFGLAMRIRRSGEDTTDE